MAAARFLTGSTMGHVVRMTATGAFGITFVFLVDAANLVWISQLGRSDNWSLLSDLPLQYSSSPSHRGWG